MDATPLNGIKCVFFDAVGTLFHVKGSVGEVYLRFAEKYGVEQSDAKIAAVNQAFREVFKKMPPPVFSVESPEKLKQCERLWWFDVVHAVFYRIGLFEGFDEYFEEVFAGFEDSGCWELYPETLEVLTQVKASGAELGLISNFDTRIFAIIRKLQLSDFFDSVTLSSLAGAVKPSPRIFHYALEQHCLLAHEAIHIGDHEQEDYVGAVNAGLHGLHLNRTAPPDSAWVIQTLSGLLEKVALPPDSGM